MSRINQIQQAIRSLGAGAYQKLMDEYLYKRYGFSNITPFGSHAGTDKTTKGTPDSYVYSKTGKYILIAYGTVTEEPYVKIEKDILACLDEQKTGLSNSDIDQIICCHTSTNINPGQHKQLCSHFKNTILIGLGELSIDLCYKYQSIARDHLSISVDTNQIFDIQDFITDKSKNQFSTPLNMPLLCRENEVQDVINLLNTEQVVMICGKPGTGKTRLALEVAEIYSKQYSCSVKIIKSNRQPIYEDLQINFTDDQNFIVIVDDADQLIQLEHLLEICISEKQNHFIKILMTVRDYAKETLNSTVRNVLIPAYYLLKPLDDNCIKKVLIDNLGILNDHYITQIQ